MLGDVIKLEGGGKWLTELFGVEWKPYLLPLIPSEKIGVIDLTKNLEIGKFEFPVPKENNGKSI